jgi:hypothetical protein
MLLLSAAGAGLMGRDIKMLPLIFPGAAACCNQIFEIDGSRALSAFSNQHLNKCCDFSCFTNKTSLQKAKKSRI